MTARVFVDTNILVYAHDRGAGSRHAMASELVGSLWSERSGVISTQVLQELYVNIRRKAANPISPQEARRVIEDYLGWEVVVNDGETVRGALDLEQRFQVSFWDALILQAAKRAGVSTVFSEDLNHSQTYDSVRVINPFRNEAD